MRQYPIFALLCLSITLSGCAGAGPEETAGPASAVEERPRRAETPAEPTGERPVVLAYGDSLTAGHGVHPERAYPAQLQDLLDESGYRYEVIQHGFSGETTSGAVARLDAALATMPEIVILEFGGNDGLRGIPIAEARRNLATAIETFEDAGARVVLAGLTLPRNYGPDYIQSFENMYVELAEEYDLVLIPFFLEGLVDLESLDSGAGSFQDFRRYMQGDGIHPTGDGYAIVAETVFETIEPYLEK